MRIGFVFPSYPGETFASAEIQALRRQGIEVVPISLWGSRATILRAREFGDDKPEAIRRIGFGIGTWLSLIDGLASAPVRFAGLVWRILTTEWARPSFAVRSLAALVTAPSVGALVAKEKLDLVHIYWGHFPAAIVPVLQWRWPALPMTLFLGAYSLNRQAAVTRDALRHVAVVTTHFGGHIDSMRRLWPITDRPIGLIPRGINLVWVRDIARQRTPGAQDNGIVTISRLEPDKTVDHSIRAFALLRNRHQGLRLTIIGGGTDLDRLQHLAELLGARSSIHFAGQLPHAECISSLATARALVMPSLSLHEYFPNCMKEAMAIGVPCIAYDIPGTASFNIAGNEVRLAAVGRIDALAQAIEDVLVDFANTDHQVRAALERVKAFDISDTSARQRDLFRTIIERHQLPVWVDRRQNGN